MKKKYKYIYGPVPSWRLGSSLGIDLLSQSEKICTFDCLYCQLGSLSEYTTERKIYVPTESIINEIKSLPELKVDYFTFSGRGEPTLAKNLGEVIQTLRQITNVPIAVLTNSSLINDRQLRDELAQADFVALKLDAYSQESLEEINRPPTGIKFDAIIDGMRKFRKEFKGRLALQIMFIEQNESHVDKFIKLAKEIKPDEIQINTPLRPSDIEFLSKDKISKIKKRFEVLQIDIISVHDTKHKKVTSICKDATLKRRGKLEF